MQLLAQYIELRASCIYTLCCAEELLIELLLHPGRNKKRGSTALDDDDDDDVYDIVFVVLSAHFTI